MKKIAIIVLNWRTPDLTIATVASLRKISHSKFTYHIFLVDNGSGDDSLPRFHEQFDRDRFVTIVETGSNLGYAEGNNYGMRLARDQHFDYQLIINSDVTVKPDFLKLLFNFLESNSEFGIVAPKIYFAPGYEFHKDRYRHSERGRVIWSFGGKIDWQNVYGSNYFIDEVDRGQFKDLKTDVDYLSGCCFLVKDEVLRKIGFFDSAYFMYSEDADFSRRCLIAGYKLAVLPDSVIWHVNSGSSSRGPIHDYFLTRNRLLFGFRYSSLRTRFALFRDSLRILFTSPLIWQKYGVRDYYLHRLGKGSWR